MIIRQRSTVMDPFLLGVVFAHPRSRRSPLLRRIAGWWNEELPGPIAPEASPPGRVLWRPGYGWLTLVLGLGVAMAPLAFLRWWRQRRLYQG